MGKIKKNVWRMLFPFLTVIMLLAWSPVFCYVSDDLDFAPMSEGAGPVGVSGKVHVIQAINYKMIYIPPGAFMMGSPSNEPGRDDNEGQHQVTLTQGYYMGVTEVTQGQWKAVMGNNPSRFNSWWPWSNCGDDCPVEMVSWIDVQLFITMLNRIAGTDKYRLPTEAEWEYACRAGSISVYCFGQNEGFLREYDWYVENSYEMPHPVGQKKANAWGLYDMHGNVCEWCQDWYGNYPVGLVTDPKGPSWGSNRVIRGGSWNCGARFCRSADRFRRGPGNRYDDLGFRLARTP